MWNLTGSDTALTFDDVCIVPRQSDVASRKGDLSWKLGLYEFKIPVISSNMTTVTGLKMALKMAELGGLGIIHRFMTPAEQIAMSNDFRVKSSEPICHSVGSVWNDVERIDLLINSGAADILCVDLAHGNNTHHMKKTIQYIRDHAFDGPIIAGNVAGPLASSELIEWGADMVKVGIGPGSVCTTRIKTGVGIPQLTAIALNSYNAGESRFPVIGDGGIRYPGDAAKALVAGATSVMIGGMLAGTDCVPNWDEDGRILLHAGNASKHVKEDFNQHNSNAEGVARIAPRKPEGSTEEVVNDICEGIRSTMSYVGAHNLEELYQRAQFYRVSSNAALENHPHFHAS